MKKCPYCGALIEDNANFCLYCMKSLNTKVNLSDKSINKKPIIFTTISLISVVLVIAALMFVFRPNNYEGENPSSGSSGSGYSGESGGSSDNMDSENDSTDGAPEPIESSEDTPTNSGTDSSVSQGSFESESDFGNSPSQSSPNETTEPVSTAEFYVDEPKNAAELWNSYVPDNCVVITGIKKPSSNGVYRIPDTIDGKRVIAIRSNAFYGDYSSTVKKIIISEKVVCINDFAFNGCFNLTDVYYCGNAIYTNTCAYYKSYSELCANGIVLHCSATCGNRNYRYYKDCASDFGLTYKEWNGVIDF